MGPGEFHGVSKIKGLNRRPLTIGDEVLVTAAESRGPPGQDRVRYLGKSGPLKNGQVAYKSLGDTGFLQFLGLFQVIMANPESPIVEVLFLFDYRITIRDYHEPTSLLELTNHVFMDFFLRSPSEPVFCSYFYSACIF